MMITKIFGKSAFACFIAACLMIVALILVPFKASADSPLNVRDYGAVGDGVTDDRAAIQSAIDAASTGLGGGVVYFPSGTYMVAEIVVLKSNITLSLDDDATILNGINIASHPSIVFMTGPYDDDSNRYIWARTENISVIGGTIDMNGTLNAQGDGCANLPYIGSSGAFALGYSDNVVIQDVDFLNSYKGHAIQVCDCNGVTIDRCTFKGQALPQNLGDSARINLETIQIEPSTEKGFPYALNNTGAASQHVTINNCYFGKSDDCGELVTAIGTHNQLVTSDKCNNIQITENTFDNPMYAGVRFCGYETVTIADNTFIKKAASESINYRSEGCYLINAYCYNNTTDDLDLNRDITIQGNSFSIYDPFTRGIRVAKDKDTYLGTVSDINIKDNDITNLSETSTDVGIQVMRVSDNIVVTGNTIVGGYRGIEMQYCAGNITMNSNNISGLDYQSVRIMKCGTNQKISLFTHGCGSINVSTANGKYTFKAIPNSGFSFIAYYGENALTSLITKNNSLIYSVDKTTNVSRHALFQ